MASCARAKCVVGGLKKGDAVGFERFARQRCEHVAYLCLRFGEGASLLVGRSPRRFESGLEPRGATGLLLPAEQADHRRQRGAGDSR